MDMMTLSSPRANNLPRSAVWVPRRHFPFGPAATNGDFRSFSRNRTYAISQLEIKTGCLDTVCTRTYIFTYDASTVGEYFE
ncbi:MAG: hypothetical protein QM681_08345 [Novosphingobium sp.]